MTPRRITTRSTYRSPNGNHNVRVTDSRLVVRTQTTVSDDPLAFALDLLKAWKDEAGIDLTRAHVETAARLAGADFGLLWDIILSPAAAAGTVEDEDPTAGFLYEAHWDRLA